MTMSDRRHVPFDELEGLAGTTVTGEPFTVSGEEIVAFERVTWVESAYPDADPDFPQGIIEGFFALSLVDPVARMTMPFDYATCWGLNYGLDRVRFVSPMYAGQPIVPTVEVLEVRPKGEGLLVLRRVTFAVAEASAPGMIADWWALLLPRGTKIP